MGPNGKPTSPATNSPRPAANTSSSNPAPTTTLRSNGTTTRQAVTTTVKVATPRVEDFPITPSHDFLKWLGESLKGLNSSVNCKWHETRLADTWRLMSHQTSGRNNLNAALFPS